MRFIFLAAAIVTLPISLSGGAFFLMGYFAIGLLQLRWTI